MKAKLNIKSMYVFNKLFIPHLHLDLYFNSLAVLRTVIAALIFYTS